MRPADRPNFRSQWPGTEQGGQTERPGVASMASSGRMHLLRNEYEAGLPEPADSSFERASEKTSSELQQRAETVRRRILQETGLNCPNAAPAFGPCLLADPT